MASEDAQVQAENGDHDVQLQVIAEPAGAHVNGNGYAAIDGTTTTTTTTTTIKKNADSVVVKVVQRSGVVLDEQQFPIQEPYRTVGLHIDLSLLMGLPNSLPAQHKLKHVDPTFTMRKAITFPIFLVVLIVAFCVVTLPFLVVGFFFWFLNLIILSIKTYCCCCCKEVKTDMVRLSNGVYKITTVSYKEQLNFLFFRTVGYIWNLAWSYAYAPARFFSCHTLTRVIPDDILARFTVGSLFAHALVETDDGGFELDATYCQKLDVFKGCYYEVTNVKLAKDGSVTQITMIDGSKHHPGDKTWDLAKLHLQGSMNTLTTCFEHSWVHFIFPDAAVVALDKIPKTSFLHQLLWPHLKYTAAINRIRTHGLSSLPINNFSCCMANWCSWLHLPYTFDTFIAANSEHSNRYYFPKDDELHGFKGDSCEHLSNFRLPPYDAHYKPLTPYHTFLYSYFLVIQGFVRRFAYDIEKDRTDYNNWVKEVAKYLPAVTKASPVDVITTLIWQVAIVHSTDHLSLNEYRPYLCGYNRRRWDPKDVDKTNDFFRSYDLVRTQAFLDNFDLPWYNPFQKLLLQDTDHGFTMPLHRIWDAEFRLALRENEQLLIAQDLNIIPLCKLIEVLCF